jgi:hypothetical protein
MQEKHVLNRLLIKIFLRLASSTIGLRLMLKSFKFTVRKVSRLLTIISFILLQLCVRACSRLCCTYV